MQTIGERIVQDIDNTQELLNAVRPKRYHLGGSMIGAKCPRSLFYAFRRVAASYFQGRMLRLFQRGHEEEFKFVKYLRSIGAEVQDYTQRLCYHPESDSYVLVNWEDHLPSVELNDVSESEFHITRATERKKGPKQWGFSDFNGHFSGSADGKIGGLERYGLVGFGLLECKTHSDKSFKELVAKGVAKAKPVHATQMQVYMRYFGLKWALYIAVNKNDDTLHIEIVHASPELVEPYVVLAEAIVNTTEAPARISRDPSWFECRFCNFKNVCHYDQRPDKSCYSCVYARASADAGWYCTKYNQDIPDKFREAGCDAWVPVK
jgi:hypothetical protein